MFSQPDNRIGSSDTRDIKGRNAFDPDFYREVLPELTERLIEYLQDNSLRGVRTADPSQLLLRARALQDGSRQSIPVSRRLLDVLDLHMDTGIAVSSKGYMGRQYSSVPPVAAIYDLISAALPQPATFYEGGPLPNVADKLISEEFGAFLNWELGTFDMVSTTGASLANLTAVLAARNRRVGLSWEEGTSDVDGLTPCIAIGADSHYSVERIAGIIGIGQSNVIKLPLDEKRRISVPHAREILLSAKESGRRVFCVVASAGTTSTGTNDPLAELSQISQQIDAWFHVDAAHNGALLVSDQYRDRVSGLRYADSFCVDAHKTLFVPAACTLLFYRDKESARSAFPSYASYVQERDDNPISAFESGIKNFECTKRPSILNLWVTWLLYGRGFFSEKIETLVDRTQEAYDLIDAAEDFVALHEPDFNILCFRYQPPGISGEDLGKLQLLIRDMLLSEGRFFISKVELDETPALRLVIMNHEISRDELSELIANIRRIGAYIRPRMLAL